MKEIEIENWNRKAQYQFFKNFDDPMFGASSNVICTNLYNEVKKTKESFFVHYMHKALQAMNEISEFRLRISEDKVLEFQKINGTTTVFKKNNTFNFCYFNYHKEFPKFYSSTCDAIDTAKNQDHFVTKNDLNLIYVSVIPWRNFTSIKHPRMFDKEDSIPKIVFGKIFEENNQLMMPVSVEAHHALLDGYHLSCFFNRFEELMKNI
ncbi:CatA-like O-acetyltransferase [Ancylomarina longa]|uniref:Chloramphenicol acetyltransferase n=1 Tax=Ancylomarina longa TaxID=2487017 RepID=A0A434ATI3_9BACT|nr:CatA-like O-acetyltransferase [Ancylomarina longa]RUT77659.1 chloramphenicol acetyltransferase [Ancylomarina longa]